MHPPKPPPVMRPPMKPGKPSAASTIDIQFAATDLVEITQARMRLAHWISHLRQIPFLKCECGVERPLVFADHVGTTLPDRDGNIFLVLLQQVFRNIAQRSNQGIPFRESPHAFFALFAARVVRASREVVLDHRIAHYELETWRNWDELEFERTTIEKKAYPAFPMQETN